MGNGSTRRIGLARALSKLGYCSRSQASAFILAGRVRVNGRVCRDPETPVQLGQDRLTVDNAPIQEAKKIYLMMNKPRGVVTTAADEKGRETVYDILKKSAKPQASFEWIAPVGRLDKASEGLLLLTNDSEWGARVSSPETHLEKTYRVQIGILADDAFTRSLMSGVVSDEGKQDDGNKRELLRARRARMLRSGQKNCWLEIVLDEGRNRQIRRMLAALDVEVLRLLRVAIGPLQLGDLAKGACRALTLAEKHSLDRAMTNRAKVQFHG